MSLHTGPALACSLLGVRFNGLQETHGAGRLVLFTDPFTKSTMALPEAEATIGNIWRKVREKREEFCRAMGGA